MGDVDPYFDALVESNLQVDRQSTNASGNKVNATHIMYKIRGWE